MFIKKSFNLTNEETQSKSTERLYQPKNFRWCTYVVVPLLIGFILLLILTNIDFTGNAYDKTWLELKDNKIVISEKSADTRIARQIKSTRGLTCTSSDNQCTLTCLGGNTNNIYKQLEPLYPICGNDMELYLYECSFPAGSMKANFLHGNFRLKTLAIIDCNLASIQAQAFEKESVNNLKSLQLIKTEFVDLSETTFMGLNGLEILNITNKIGWSSLKGENFLKPLANTLKTLRIVAESIESETYNPYQWLQDTNLSQLEELDFSDNNFADGLTMQIFANMKRVQKLNLSNCRLNYLPTDLFDAMLETLLYLDLSWNFFTTLNDQMLGKLKGLQSLTLGNNHWDCSCLNWVILKMLKENVAIIEDNQNVKCFTPSELWNDNIFSVELQCEDKYATSDISSDIASTTKSGNETGEDTTENLSTLTTDIGSNSTETTPSQGTASSTQSTSNETTCGETCETTEFTTTTPVNMSTTSNTTPGTSTFTTTTGTTTFTTTAGTSSFTTTVGTSTTKTELPTTSTEQATTPSPFVHIYCNDSVNNKIVVISVSKPQTHFTIVPQSPTSVAIVVSQQSLTVFLLYFTNYTSAVQWSNRFSTQSRLGGSSLLVSDLMPTEAYVFCLVPHRADEVSPFDCKSYYVQVAEAKGWIMNEDQTWIIALVVLGACLCTLLGFIVIFFVVRLKKRRKIKKYLLRMQTESPRDRSVGSGASNNEDPDSEVSLNNSNSCQTLSRDIIVAPQRTIRNQNNNLHFYEEMESE